MNTNQINNRKAALIQSIKNGLPLDYSVAPGEFLALVAHTDPVNFSRGFDTIPDGVTIGKNAFKDCVQLTTANIGAVTVVTGFAGCENLKSVTLAEGVREIDFSAFTNCTSLEKINLPSTLKSVKGFSRQTLAAGGAAPVRRGAVAAVFHGMGIGTAGGIADRRDRIAAVAGDILCDERYRAENEHGRRR